MRRATRDPDDAWARCGEDGGHVYVTATAMGASALGIRREERGEVDLGGRAPRRSEASGKKISRGRGASVEALSSRGMAGEVVRRRRARAVACTVEGKATRWVCVGHMAYWAAR